MVLTDSRLRLFDFAGIMLYEMLSGESPFYFDGVPETELYRSIEEDEVPPISENVSEAAKELVFKLLEKDPLDRIGSLAGGEKEIVDHKWFAGINRSELRNRKLKAPWRPNVKDPFDVSSFEDWGDIEDITAV